jgi:hypothetical protein
MAKRNSVEKIITKMIISSSGLSIVQRKPMKERL